MECPQTIWPGNTDYLQRFREKVEQRRIPLFGSLDLTHRCNLRCVHCYLRPHQMQCHNEMTTEQVLSIVDTVTEAGCLDLLITGGEPLLREDFSAIYRRAKTNGLLVTLFTNGTMITDTILEVFEELPPRAVEVTLYGATAETYERVTRVKGSYERCLEGIRRLLERAINVKIKTILMTCNRHEFFDMENMAREYGVKFRFDAAIFPRLDGDKSPLRLRVSPEEAIEKELANEDRLCQWQDFFTRFQGIPALDSLYQCGAGLTTFHVDPYGNLQPCMMVHSHKYDLLGGSFSTGWRDAIPRIREQRAGTGYACNQCNKRAMCGYCPGFFELETGSAEVRSDYLCAMGHLRFQAIQDHSKNESC